MFKVKSWATIKDGMDVFVRHLKQKQLPAVLVADISNPPVVKTIIDKNCRPASPPAPAKVTTAVQAQNGDAVKRKHDVVDRSPVDDGPPSKQPAAESPPAPANVATDVHVESVNAVKRKHQAAEPSPAGEEPPSKRPAAASPPAPANVATTANVECGDAVKRKPDATELSAAGQELPSKGPAAAGNGAGQVEGTVVHVPVPATDVADSLPSPGHAEAETEQVVDGNAAVADISTEHLNTLEDTCNGPTLQVLGKE